MAVNRQVDKDSKVKITFYLDRAVVDGLEDERRLRIGAGRPRREATLTAIVNEWIGVVSAMKRKGRRQ